MSAETYSIVTTVIVLVAFFVGVKMGAGRVTR